MQLAELVDCRPGRRGEHGLTLVETLVAVAVVALFAAAGVAIAHRASGATLMASAGGRSADNTGSFGAMLELPATQSFTCNDAYRVGAACTLVGQGRRLDYGGRSIASQNAGCQGQCALNIGRIAVGFYEVSVTTQPIQGAAAPRFIVASPQLP